MIIDAHTHAFPCLMNPYGERSYKQQILYLQRFVASSPAAAVKRVRDNSVVTDKSEYVLWDENDPTPNGALEVNFHPARFGRLAWKKNGEEYYISLYAPNMQNMESSPEFLLAHMDAAGVSMAVLQNAFLYGDLNDYISEAVAKYPKRFIGTIQINEAKAFEETEIEKLIKYGSNPGFRAIYFANERFFENGFTTAIDDEIFFPFWERARDLGLAVFWDISAIHEPNSRESSPFDRFLKQMRRLESWHKRFPEIPSILVHGIPLRNIRDGDRFLPIPDDLWKIWKRKNMYLEFLFPMQVSHPVPGGSVFDYPYLELHPLIKDLLSNLGPEKLIWGTDLPNTERNCTYRQARLYLETHCNVLSESDKKMVLGENIQRLLNIN